MSTWNGLRLLLSFCQNRVLTLIEHTLKGRNACNPFGVLVSVGFISRVIELKKYKAKDKRQKAQTHDIEIFKINHFCGKTLHTSKNQEIEEKHPIHLAGAFDSFIESEGMAFSLTIHGI